MLVPSTYIVILVLGMPSELYGHQEYTYCRYTYMYEIKRIFKKNLEINLFQ